MWVQSTENLESLELRLICTAFLGFFLAAVCFHAATQGVAFKLSDNCRWFVILSNIYILLPGIFMLGCRLLDMYNPRDQTIGKASVFSQLIDNFAGQMNQGIVDS